MELKVVDQKPLKKTYYSFLAICSLITAGSTVLYFTGIGFFQFSGWAVRLKDIFLLLVVCGAAIFFFFQQAQRKKMAALTDFNERVAFFETFYRTRLWWQVFSCVLSGFLLLVTRNIIFLGFCLFDYISMLIAYPSPLIIKKELGDDDIIVS